MAQIDYNYHKSILEINKKALARYMALAVFVGVVNILFSERIGILLIIPWLSLGFILGITVNGYYQYKSSKKAEKLSRERLEEFYPYSSGSNIF